MIQKIFAVRDLKAQAFLQPFFSVQNGSAIRAFGDECLKQGSPFNAHPEDYVLFEIGALNDQSGEITPVWPVQSLVMGSDFVTAPAVPVRTNGAVKEAV